MGKNRKYSTYFVRYNSHHVVKTSMKLLTSLLMTSKSLIAPYIQSLNFRAKRRMPYLVVDTNFVLLLYCFKWCIQWLRNLCQLIVGHIIIDLFVVKPRHDEFKFRLFFHHFDGLVMLINISKKNKTIDS